MRRFCPHFERLDRIDLLSILVRVDVFSVVNQSALPNTLNILQDSRHSQKMNLIITFCFIYDVDMFSMLIGVGVIVAVDIRLMI